MTESQKVVDPDVELDLYPFPIPDLKALRGVMLAENRAIQEINYSVRNISTASNAIVDPMGKPIPSMGGTLATQIRELVDRLLASDTLSKGYVVDPEGELTGFEPAGLKLAFLTYQGLGLLIRMQHGEQFAMAIANQIDVLLVLSLKAIQRGRNPLRVFEKVLQFKAMDPATELPLIGEPDWAQEKRAQLVELYIAFLITGDYVTSELEPKDGVALITTEDELPFLALNDRGIRLYEHLRDQVAFKARLTSRGRAIVEALKEENLTESQILASLNGPLDGPLKSTLT